MSKPSGQIEIYKKGYERGEADANAKWRKVIEDVMYNERTMHSYEALQLVLKEMSDERTSTG